MDEEYGSEQPFLFFTDYTGDLAETVREGRRREFAKFSAFSDEKRRAAIPDPNDPRTFAMSSPTGNEGGEGGNEGDGGKPARAADRTEWMHFYKSALTVRAKLITPRLAHAKPLGATVLKTASGDDADALVARWRLGDGATLSLALNLAREAVQITDLPAGKTIFETPPRVRDALAVAKALPSFSLVAWVTGDVSEYASGHDARRVTAQERSA